MACETLVHTRAHTHTHTQAQTHTCTTSYSHPQAHIHTLSHIHSHFYTPTHAQAGASLWSTAGGGASGGQRPRVTESGAAAAALAGVGLSTAAAGLWGARDAAQPPRASRSSELRRSTTQHSVQTQGSSWVSGLVVGVGRRAQQTIDVGKDMGRCVLSAVLCVGGILVGLCRRKRSQRSCGLRACCDAWPFGFWG